MSNFVMAARSSRTLRRSEPASSAQRTGEFVIISGIQANCHDRAFATRP